MSANVSKLCAGATWKKMEDKILKTVAAEKYLNKLLLFLFMYTEYFLLLHWLLIKRKTQEPAENSLLCGNLEIKFPNEFKGIACSNQTPGKQNMKCAVGCRNALVFAVFQTTDKVKYCSTSKEKQISS